MRPPLALRQERALDRAYRRHVADLYRYAVAVLDDHDDAEDAVCATFLRASLRLRRRKETPLHLNALLRIAHDVCRRRSGDACEPITEERASPLVCERVERAISRQLDDRLQPSERRLLRRHLRACNDCVQFDRSLRAQRAALRALAAMPLPESVQACRSRWPRRRAGPVRKFLPVRASS